MSAGPTRSMVKAPALVSPTPSNPTRGSGASRAPFCPVFAAVSEAAARAESGEWVADARGLRPDVRHSERAPDYRSRCTTTAPPVAVAATTFASVPVGSLISREPSVDG